MNVTEIVFWVSLSAVGYVYVAYPLLVWLLARLFDGPSTRTTRGQRPLPDGTREWPTVSLIIPALYAEERILERLNNAALIDYPRGRLEVIVGCDGTRDLTCDQVRAFSETNVRIVQIPKRQLPKKGGRGQILNECICQSTGEIVILSDSETMMQPDAVRKLASHFDDRRIGAVSGRLVLDDRVTGLVAGGIGRLFNCFLQECEGRLGGLLNVNASIFAVRRELIPPNLSSEECHADFLVIGLQRRGLRTVFDRLAVARRPVSPVGGSRSHHGRRLKWDSSRWWRRAWPLLIPLHGRTAWILWSTRVARPCVPVFLAAGIVTNFLLSGHPVYLRILLLHEACYAVVLISLLLAQVGRRARISEKTKRDQPSAGTENEPVLPGTEDTTGAALPNSEMKPVQNVSGF